MNGGGMPTRVVFDIETSGFDFDTLDESQQAYLTKFCDTPEKREEEKLKVNLYPYTAEVVSIAMLNVDSLHGEVMVQGPSGKDWETPDQNVFFRTASENEILEWFWSRITKFDQFITFNGRGFDAPFLHIRSAIRNVKSTRNLMPYRYDSKNHYDILEQLTFYNAYRKFSLDFICTSFGIDSPKRQGITGHDINQLHREGKYRDIAEYNFRDVLATRELFLRIEHSFHS